MKTSGISAEYGGALGGVVSAVTKSGGNVFRGEVALLLRGQRADRPIPSSAWCSTRWATRPPSIVQDAERRGSTTSSADRSAAQSSATGLFFFGSYSPRNERQTSPYNFDDGSKPGHSSANEIWRQQAFGKLTYAQQSRDRPAGRRCGRPTVQGLRSPAYQGSGNKFVYEVAGRRSTFEGQRGYEIEPAEHERQRGSVADEQRHSCSFRGGYFHDGYARIRECPKQREPYVSDAQPRRWMPCIPAISSGPERIRRISGACTDHGVRHDDSAASTSTPITTTCSRVSVSHTLKAG